MTTVSSRWLRLLPALLLPFLSACDEEAPADPGPAGPTFIQVSPLTATMASLGSTVKYTAYGKDRSGELVELTGVRWVSSDPEAVSVAEDGTATAVGAGTATIRASLADGSVSNTASAVVRQEVVDLEFGFNTRLISMKMPLHMEVIGRDPSGARVEELPPLRWTTSDPTVATVDDHGAVHGLRDGTVRLKVETLDGKLAEETHLRVVQTVTLVVDFSTLPNGAVPSGSYPVDLMNSNTAADEGDVDLVTVGPSGTTFKATGPLRIGFINGGGWRIPASGISVDGVSDPRAVWTMLCFINVSGVNAGNPVKVTARLTDGSSVTWDIADPENGSGGDDPSCHSYIDLTLEQAAILDYIEVVAPDGAAVDIDGWHFFFSYEAEAPTCGATTIPAGLHGAGFSDPIGVTHFPSGYGGYGGCGGYAGLVGNGGSTRLIDVLDQSTAASSETGIQLGGVIPAVGGGTASALSFGGGGVQVHTNQTVPLFLGPAAETRTDLQIISGAATGGASIAGGAVLAGPTGVVPVVYDAALGRHTVGTVLPPSRYSGTPAGAYRHSAAGPIVVLARGASYAFLYLDPVTSSPVAVHEDLPTTAGPLTCSPPVCTVGEGGGSTNLRVYGYDGESLGARLDDVSLGYDPTSCDARTLENGNLGLVCGGGTAGSPGASELEFDGSGNLVRQEIVDIPGGCTGGGEGISGIGYASDSDGAAVFGTCPGSGSYFSARSKLD